MPYVVRVTWAEGQYQGTSPTTISANVGNAVANGGGQAAIATSIVFGVGGAAAAGSAFSLPVTLPTQVGNADAGGSAVAINEAISAGAGNAVAAGAATSISEAVALLVGNATAAGSTFAIGESVTLPMLVGNAVAEGSTGSVYLYSVQVTWAELEYQPLIDNVTIECNVGNANSGGPIGATFTVDSAIQMGTANAVAAGLPFGYSSNTQVTTFIANAVAAGKRASGFAWSVQTTPGEVWTPVLIES